MNRKYTTVIASIAIVVLLAGLLAVEYFAYTAGIWQCLYATAGVAVSLLLSPVLHELGHVLFARASDMQIMLVKCFCFLYVREDKRRFRFISPFAADKTEIMPMHGDNMQKRAIRYALGGLILEGLFALLVLVVAILLSAFGCVSYFVWGIVPYALYLFVLNVLPLEYPLGKTDSYVAMGLKRGYDSERTMLSAMEIQGRLYEGKTFTQIDERLYFDLPQLAEDDPLFAVILHLQYRYYLEKNDMENAADRLNRLAAAQAYLSDTEVEKIAAELVYMHSLNGDFERANDCGKICQNFLQSDEIAAKRALAAFTFAFGESVKAETLLTQASELIAQCTNRGLAAAEDILLRRQ